MLLFSLSPKDLPLLEAKEKGIDIEEIAKSPFFQKKGNGHLGSHFLAVFQLIIELSFQNKH